jgi:antitoxin FitA
LPQIDLATAIDRRFADIGEFELPETPRDAMRVLLTENCNPI